MDYETKVRQGVPEPNPGRIWEASILCGILWGRRTSTRFWTQNIKTFPEANDSMVEEIFLYLLLLMSAWIQV
jgi:hypothetical protein